MGAEQFDLNRETDWAEEIAHRPQFIGQNLTTLGKWSWRNYFPEFRIYYHCLLSFECEISRSFISIFENPFLLEKRKCFFWKNAFGENGLRTKKMWMHNFTSPRKVHLFIFIHICNNFRFASKSSFVWLN